MVVIRHVQSRFRQRENLCWEKHIFVNDLVGFPSQKKSKVVYEGLKARECQGVPGNSRKY